MSAMALPAIDPRPLLQFLQSHGGECSFDDAMNVLRRQGLDDTDARDGLWRWLSVGLIIFTPDRRLRLANMPLERAAG
jgi:hypothetical protein